MGLDMCLEAEMFLSSYSDKPQFNALSKVVNEHVAVNPFPESLNDMVSASVTMTVAYWRKANQIHDWFVQNVQDGIDECQRSYVSYENLVELQEVCENALNLRNTISDPQELVEQLGELLPTSQGFFFGSSEYDSYYWEDIQKTAEFLSRFLEWFEAEAEVGNHWAIFYQSSW
jgi:hypothetical protein